MLVQMQFELEQQLPDPDRESTLSANCQKLHEMQQLLSIIALKGNWQGYYRVRIGSYRALYTLEHEQQFIVVREIDHRSVIYDE